MCHRAIPNVCIVPFHRSIANVSAFGMMLASAMCHRTVATVEASAMCYRAIANVETFAMAQASAMCDCQKLSRAGVHTF